MTQPSAASIPHPIASKWPALHPERLQLYSLPTPNGVKVSILLEELGLPYEAHLVMGDDYTIADIAIFPWVRNLIGFYGAGDLVGIQDFVQVRRALDAFGARPAVVRGPGHQAAPELIAA